MQYINKMSRTSAGGSGKKSWQYQGRGKLLSDYFPSHILMTKNKQTNRQTNKH